MSCLRSSPAPTGSESSSPVSWTIALSRLLTACRLRATPTAEANAFATAAARPGVLPLAVIVTKPVLLSAEAETSCSSDAPLGRGRGVLGGLVGYRRRGDERCDFIREISCRRCPGPRQLGARICHRLRVDQGTRLIDLVLARDGEVHGKRNHDENREERPLPAPHRADVDARIDVPGSPHRQFPHRGVGWFICSRSSQPH